MKNDTSIRVKVDHLSGINRRGTYWLDYYKDDSILNLKKPKQVIYHGPYYNTENDMAIIEVKSLDNKDRWITLLNPNTGEIKELNHQHDDFFLPWF